MELGPLLSQEGFIIVGVLVQLAVLGVIAFLAYLVIKAAVRKGVLAALTEHDRTLRAGAAPEVSRPSN